MYKCKLQELCQRRRWELPEYSTAEEGPHHIPRFSAAVNVGGVVFRTTKLCRSAKGAQNTAARIALDHFTAPPPRVSPPPAEVSAQVLHAASLPIVSPSSVSFPTMEGIDEAPRLVSPLPSSLPIPPPGLLLQPKRRYEDTRHTSMVHRMATVSDDKNYKGMLHIYKNRLQQYAQKQNLSFPTYTCEVEGPPHARRYKSRINLDGKSYETLEFFPSLKESEQASAKVACQVLSMDVVQEGVGLYKNLLQEFTQNRGLLYPLYETDVSGLSHVPVFVSTVKIGNDTFQGAEAANKKQAEMNAAKVAYYSLSGKCLATQSATVPSISECAVVDNLKQNIEPVAMSEQHQDARDEEAHDHREGTKSLSEEVKVNADLPCSSQPSDDPNLPSSLVKNSISTKPALGQSSGNQSIYLWKTIVVRRRLDSPIPEGATELHRNAEWITYKVEVPLEPIS